ncbi:MAG: arsC [Candidatus Angelobacter sp.]|nr:arsC [Candidatus Angelobacter sp.]
MTTSSATVRKEGAVEGSDEQIERAFHNAFLMLDRRISLFLCLPFASLDKLAIQKEIDQIGGKGEPSAGKL